MSFTLRNPRHSGFSILQVAVLLAVASIVLVAAIPGGIGGADDKKREITLQRMNAIEEATSAFMVKNARRPCPADGTLAITNANFGKEFGSGACDPETSNPNFEFTGGDGDGNTLKPVAGIPPVRALGLSDEYAFDGWGRRMMYIVDWRATVAGTFSRMIDSGAIFDDADQTVKSCSDLQTENRLGSIRIFASSDDLDPPQTVKDNTMWALISYGKYGHGAFPAEGALATGTVADRIDARGGDTGAFPEAAYINAFVDYTGGSAGAMSATRFYGELVQQNIDTAAKYDNIVWYKQQTKNICALGRNALRGTYMNLGSVSLEPIAGTAIATGDINGDGIKDLIIGNWQSNIAHIIFGSKIGWPVNSAINKATVATGTGGFTITNTTAFDILTAMGIFVGAGDVNGDGYDDILLSSATGVFSGAWNAIVIVFGGSNDTLAGRLTSGNINTAALDGTSGLILYYYHRGATLPGVVLAGDVTGNGGTKKDLIMTAGYGGNGIYVIKNRSDWKTKGCDLGPLGIGYVWDIATGDFSGIAAIVASLCPAPQTPDAINTADGYLIYSSDTTNVPVGSGLGIAAADIDRDGDAELIVGEQGASSNAGKILVLRPPFTPSVGTEPETSYVNITGTAWFTGTPGSGRYFTASSDSGSLGAYVTADDMNNDGYADIMAASATRIYGYSGSALNTGWTTGAPAAIDMSSATTNLWMINIATNKPTWLTIDPGSSAVPYLKAHDINGDGLLDLIFSVQSSGTPSGCLGAAQTVGSTYVINQPTVGFFASAAAPTYGFSNLTYANAKGLFSGTSNSGCDALEINTATNYISNGAFRIDGPMASAFSYLPLVTDLNGDGKNDIVIGSTGYSASPAFSSRVDILWGRRNTAWETLPGKNVYQLPTSLP